MLVIESFFLFDVIFTFFVEFEVDGQIQPVRDLKSIAVNYLKGQLIFDVLPLLPLQLIPLKGEERMFYIIKLIRIGTGIEFLSPQQISEYVTKYNIERI